MAERKQPTPHPQVTRLKEGHTLPHVQPPKFKPTPPPPPPPKK